MAIYKLRKRISSTTTEEIKIPYSQIDGAPNVDEFVDLTSEQTISGVKRFTNTNGIFIDRIHNLNGNAVYDYDGTNIRIGGLTKPLHFRGSLSRPKYMKDGGSLKDVALVEDIPTNASDITNDSFVSYNAQTLSDSQKSQARTNIGAVSKDDTIAKAGKLETARTISVGTAVSATAKSFDGTSNIEIPINSVKEAYLTWGGKSLSGNLSPIDAAISPLHHNNVFAFANPAGIEVEYSNDAGETWIDYGAPDSGKVALVSGLGYSLYIGKKIDAQATTDDQLRITLTSNTITGNMGVYCYLRKLLIKVSTGGATGCKVLVERSRIGNEDTFTRFGEYDLSGWSGWNSIDSSIVFGGAAANTSQIRRIRLTFSISGVSANYNSNLTVWDILGIATVTWGVPSSMASNGHLYSYDANKNATFPANVYANQNKLLATQEYAQGLINELDVNDKATEKQYVTSVSEAAGKIAVTRKQIDYSELNGTPTIPTVNNPTINIQKNGSIVGSFTLNQSSGSTINITTLFDNIQYYAYGSTTASFTLVTTSAKYLRIATGKVTTTSEIKISLPTGANYYYVGYWTSPYSNSSSTTYSDSISGYMPSSTTDRVIATIKASSAKTAPFLFIYWQA